MRAKYGWLGAGLVLIVGGILVWQSPTLRAQINAQVSSAAPAPAEGQAGGRANARPQPVFAAPVESGPQPIEITAIGSVQAAEVVGVKARLDGIILNVHISDGQEVKEGDLLFTLDSRAIEAQLRQAEANLQRDMAVSANAKRTLERQQALMASNIASQQAFDTARTASSTADQSIKASQAQIEALRVNLGYTKITAPISGRAGEIKLTKGNLVKANDASSLVTIRKLRPINVLFSVPQKHFSEMRDAMATGKVGVIAQTPDQPDSRSIGHVSFYDNTIDQTTGTFQAKAVFPNEDNSLWPGMFAPITVRLGVQQDALSIASAAVQTGQQGQYVYVVIPAEGAADAKQAELRPVTVARTVGNRSVIAKGLAAGEIVVTDGQLRLTNGTRVEIRDPAAAAAPQQRGNRPGGASSGATPGQSGAAQPPQPPPARS
ncbi:MAG: efflux RND transporter periplasmic adaptor subunit [Elstera sp.]